MSTRRQRKLNRIWNLETTTEKTGSLTVTKLREVFGPALPRYVDQIPMAYVVAASRSRTPNRAPSKKPRLSCRNRAFKLDSTTTCAAGPGFKLSGLATRWSGFRLQPSKSANTCTRRPGAASSALLRLPNWSPHQQIYLEVQLWAIRIGVHLGLSQPTLPPNLGDTAVPSLRTGCSLSSASCCISTAV